jgi:hypothetical protein
LALFEGSRATSPAAALAGWKRATRGTQTLGKGWEAAIAALNPEMFRELKLLDGGEVAFALGPHVRWYAALPSDDGTFGALATAMALTDGAAETPIHGASVDRLGPPGAPLMARTARGLVVAGTRDDVTIALSRLQRSPTQAPPVETGWLVHVDPLPLREHGNLTGARLAEALLALGFGSLDGRVSLDGQQLTAVVEGVSSRVIPQSEGIVPAWLDWVPKENVVAAISLAFDPRPDTWDALFALADRVEKVDPAFAKTAPLRARLNVLALGARVRPEVDLWPRLRGITACATLDAAGECDGILIAVHAVDPAAAELLMRDVVPRLAVLLKPSETNAELKPSGVLSHGSVRGRPLRSTRRDATILIGWGEEIVSRALAAGNDQACSAGEAIRVSWSEIAPQRAGAFWPGRLRRVVAPGTPLAAALEPAQPVLWWGTDDARRSRDRIVWNGLGAIVRRFLERLPLEPAPVP